MSLGLVLEGGGMRGAYTSGILQVFEENHIMFPSIYGISAGACTALSYISKQSYRNLEIFSRYIPTHEYVSRRNFIKCGSIFGYDYIFGPLFHDQLPFDYQAFYQSPVRLRVGATDVETGRCTFFDKNGFGDDMLPIQASSALPFVSKMVEINGRKYLDGGVSMPIPVEQSIFDGNEYNIVILTRDASYVRKLKPDFPKPFIEARFHKYPNFIRAMLSRPQVYREEVEYCRRLEEKGKALVFRPSVPIVVGRCEKDPEKLIPIYELGVQDARRRLEEVKAFLSAHGEPEGL